MVLTPECESFLYFEILSLKCEADFLNSAFYILLDHQMIKPYLGNWYARNCTMHAFSAFKSFKHFQSEFLFSLKDKRQQFDMI